MEESVITCAHCNTPMKVDRMTGTVYCVQCGYIRNNCESTCKTCCSPGYVLNPELVKNDFHFICSNPKCPKYNIIYQDGQVLISFGGRQLMYANLEMMKLVSNWYADYAEDIHEDIKKSLLNKMVENIVKDEDMVKVLEEKCSCERNEY